MIPLQAIWQSILDWENLLLAYRKARHGKRNQAEIQQFGFDLEYELTGIRQALLQKTYQPGGFRQFQVCDRKIRLISAAPFRDRVVQHALMNQVEPVLDQEFIPDSYASRKLKGVHVAVRQYRVWANRYAYALKIDISRYFDSMDHQILKQKLARLIADPDVLWLFNTIIDSSPWPTNPMVVKYPDDDLMDLAQRAIGLPLGNLTSQFLGNVYLNDLDYFIKETLQVPAYLRYVDDMILLADDKATLWDWCEQIECFLAKERIGIHPRKKMLVPVAAGLDVLGYRVFPDKTRLSRGSGYQFRRKLKHLAKAYHANRMTLTEIKPHVAGWLGHARQADSRGLCKAILAQVYFSKGDAAKRSPGGSGRFVEQQSTELAIG
ncbi:MAG: RNA-directed DNA polymerase [Nitrosomonas sp.]|uniref:RNA-directed DNA polymerase n=1 Tax=Nitrosomonas sp. TaxID=42353 RepID=UPI00273045F6|nr:RNA-directed DNA polymerase [Nitrosomonas sp.]MDP1549434.1 RNA-directed DNA polymerase [Nitrosomonas sp.]MDP3280695.1 RNA-directed DNA polymerase [Nitrosomonas sp.]